LALHYEARFLKTPGSMERAVAGFESILKRYSDGNFESNMPLAQAKSRQHAIN
jgi:hypothetical protein